MEAKAAALGDLHKLQLKELEIKQKKAEIELEAEISAVDAEKRAYEEAEAEELDEFAVSHNRPLTPIPSTSGLKPVDTQALTAHFVKDEYHTVSNSPPASKVFNPIPQSAKTKLSPLAREFVGNTDNKVINQDSLFKDGMVTSLMENQNRANYALEQLVQQQQENIMALTLPQPNMPVFNGDPSEYCNFVRSFQHLVEEKTVNPSVRLYYLIQYTSGQVQELMRSCLSMEPVLGYIEGRRLLKERYGQNYRIAEALIQKLIDGPQIRAEDGAALQHLSILLTSCTNTLREIGYINKLNSSENLKKIIDRLPYGMRVRWREAVDSIIEREGRDVTIEDIASFVSAKARAASHPVFGKISEPLRTKPVTSIKQHRLVKAANYATSGNRSFKDSDQREEHKSKPQCPLCSDSHWLARCERFRKMALEDRMKFVKEKRLCNNCLTKGHFVNACTKDSFCKVEECDGKHSTFLHPKNTSEMPMKCNEESAKSASIKKSSIPLHTSIGLSVVPVRVKAPGKSNVIETYAFLDNGSNTTFCTEELMQSLGIQGKRTTLSLTTMRDSGKPLECFQFPLEIFDLQENNQVDLPVVYSTPKLPVSKEDIARREDIKCWPHLQGIDIQTINADVGLLIGSNVPQALQPQEVRMGEKGSPYGTKTIFGWTVNGPLGRLGEQKASTNYIKADVQLSQQFRQFCDLEFNDHEKDSDIAMSRNDSKALNIMEESIELNNHHYQLAMPWKQFPPNLENDKPLAEHRLNLLKKRLAKENVTKERYSKFMNDLIANGHAKQVPIEEINNSSFPVWYLPHFPVYHPQKPDKVRVVFDCSAKWRGTSLNDQLLQGPDLTNSLVGVLIRFRQEPIALMSDIEAMFYQVYVRPIDTNCLRFLWWPDGNLEKAPVEFKMLVHLFGGTSSPSCANFALRKTATDNQADFDKATVDTVLNNFYVDDCLKSVPTVQHAIKLTSQLREMLDRGGFRLTKWISNSKDVLLSIPECERAASVKSLDFDGLTERALGIHWNVEEDAFNFKIAIRDKPVTRRGFGEAKSYELHHFSDASQQAYGCVSYLRAINEKGEIHCAQVMAKSRLSPMKMITIPRLELSAAVLATRIDYLIRKESRNLEVGDVVLILNESTPRSSWPLGRILDIYHNMQDGLVRSVKLKTSTSVIIRPVDKLVLLEAADEVN